MGKGKGGGVMSKDGGDGAARNQRVVGEKEWAAVVAGADNALRGEIDSPDWLYLAMMEELAARLVAFWGPSPGVLDTEAAWWGTLDSGGFFPWPYYNFHGFRKQYIRKASEIKATSIDSAGANRGWEFQKHGQDLDGDDDQECLPAGVDPHPGLCNVEITATGPIASGEELGEVSSSQRLPATKPKSLGVPGVSGREKNGGKGSRTGLPGLTGLEKSLFAALTNVKFPRATTDHRPGTEMASLGPV
ncbi:hypothetical protein CABS01_00389 [Colletotrichum abscissum]|uniref:Uncharacterized protein n=1 Tax=Colletotrichum abscissum TaxID=1671311 RepID=A0A9P9XTR7_9PEZI|nr:uncharacterized protein CABS01_00389 [Colletotrichum abscissum]KAI3559317.1 hypothetical protein CABS02_00292 [Colletotrichum abscissum]KAK1525300.1 hypothetical protein CABS01_00389 [Colletotrichum abscissum]